ncbi:c-type cytochrome [Maritimibacter dapengensis]|uniref:Cytochrome c n=1 Tax=Maritimibacter dapengensis TaxID=2836868 RepID=A0ABS6T099_9RHOB|nr:cytochrome c [Maritimibacter dapengensis]MBV7377807.1 cytochrome c [Maritimibacter dapengensis]
MNKTILLAIVAAILAGGAYLFIGGSTPDETAVAPSTDPAEGAALVSISLPDSLSQEAKIGKTAFDAVCAACHGENATGIDGSGPPLVHKIYEPGHHGDMSFQLAVQRGVPAHHWKFGDMPPQEGLTQGDVSAITTYVRELQQANGID